MTRRKTPNQMKLLLLVLIGACVISPQVRYITAESLHSTANFIYPQ